MGDIANAVQGQLQGAIKRYDTDDALPEGEVERVAEVLADQFEEEVSRYNVSIQESLSGE